MPTKASNVLAADPVSYRLQMEPEDKVGGKLWIGPEGRRGQAVWEAADSFRLYVNRLLDAFGNLSSEEVDAIAERREEALAFVRREFCGGTQ